jgi:outer membrane protein assembly factor BamB
MVLIGSLAAGVGRPGGARADDWPSYGHDIARSQVTAEKLSLPLEPCWAFKARHVPQPAWGDPKAQPVEGILELRRVHFDDVFQVAAADGCVYFGSSADNKIFCLDASTGKVRWTVFTAGPVRLAPTVAGGRVYVGSDDGFVYCLAAADGAILWKLHAAPEDRRVLGHGKMISLWPVRTGVLVDGDVAYFAAGVFPAEGVFFCAVDARTGRQIWRNDTGGEAPQSRISPQGYLLASRSTLYAPMGRVSPAAFDRKTGQLTDQAYFGKNIGGTYALLADQRIFTGTEEMVSYPERSVKKQDRFVIFDAHKLVVSGDLAYVASGDRLFVLDRKRYPPLSAKLNSLLSVRENEKNLVTYETNVKQARENLKTAFPWQVPLRCDQALILAGDLLFAGGDGQVAAIEAASGKTVWTARVEGVAKGLAVAGGRLLVSTDKGLIYAFGPAGSSTGGLVSEPVDESVLANAPSAQAAASEAAAAILGSNGVRRGYCLVLGCATGQLAMELAKRSELMIYAVSPDAEKVAAMRRAIDAAGLYGTRICVEQWPLEKVPYADYFANLIVSEPSSAGDKPLSSQALAEVLRMLKPIGGEAWLPQRAVGKDDLSSIAEQARQQGVAATQDGEWLKLVRGPLPGAGSWTHEYANPGNTACGDDQRLKCPLTVLWFGQPGPGEMVPRHERSVAPLSIDGRVFHQGEDVVMAYDAYNGLKLWERPIAGARRTGVSGNASNFVVCRDGLLVAMGDRCLRLDPVTGETLAAYPLPPGPRAARWVYLACDGGLIYGSRTDNLPKASLAAAPARFNFASSVFAMDLQSGEVKWTYAGKSVGHSTISIGDGRLYLVDQDVAPQQREQVLAERHRQIANLPTRERLAAERALKKADVRLVVALDAANGKVLWREPMDVTFGTGGVLATMCSHGLLVVFNVYSDGHFWQQFFAGEFAGRRVAVLSGEDGKLLWTKALGYRVRPLIIGDTLHAEPWAFDLRTGEQRTRVNPITGQTEPWQFARPGHHCGCPNASPYALFFRSFCLGYYDLVGDFGTQHFGGQRPGCWINFIPAAGLLIMPEASAGCMCPFPNMCTVVFEPAERTKGWGYYSASGPTTPVRRLALHFGAMGDRKDAAGKLWLAYPRPGGSLVLPLRVGTTICPGGAYVARNSAYTPIAGTDDPWLFASAANGLTKCIIPLVGPADGTARYRVRLALADPDNDRPAQRVFDIKLQGKTVCAACDVVKESGGRDRALWKEFTDVEVTGSLALELAPKTPRPTPDKMPILQGIEIERQQIVGLGCAVPKVELNRQHPRQAAEMELGNFRDEEFQGTLEFATPAGLRVTPQRTTLKLASGTRTTVAIEVATTEALPIGTHSVPIRLLRADGSLEGRQTLTVEYLGRRGRVVLAAIEDAYVSHRYPELNKGTAGVLLVDGGDREVGDLGHSLAYIKFRLKVPGKPVRAVLRLYNAGNPTGDSGRLCLVTEPWQEEHVTYNNRPKLGAVVGRLGSVTEQQGVECPLELDLEGKTELSLAIDPTSCGGVDYVSREGGKPPELIVEYELP